MKYVEVFIGDLCHRPLDFKTNLDLKPDDHVVCDTRFGIYTGVVIKVKDHSEFADMWAFQKVDMSLLKEANGVGPYSNMLSLKTK